MAKTISRGEKGRNMKLSRWGSFLLCCLILLVVGIIKENFFIYLTIRMYGFDYNPIDHFKQGYYNLFTAIPSVMLMPIKYTAFAIFAVFYFLYQCRVLRFFFPKINFKPVLLYFFGIGGILLLVLLPFSKKSTVVLGIYQAITVIYLSPFPMILCFLFEEATSGNKIKE